MSHKLNHFEPLLKMKALSGTGHVNTAFKVISRFAVNRGCDISCCIKRSAIFFKYHAWRKRKLVKVDQICAFTFFKKLFFFQFFYHIKRFVVIETLPCPWIKVHSHKIINLLKLGHAYVLKPLPQSQRFLVALLHTDKPFSGFILK